MDSEDISILLGQIDPQLSSLGDLVKAIVKGECMIMTVEVNKHLLGQKLSSETEAKTDAVRRVIKRCYAELDRREKIYRDIQYDGTGDD